MDVSKFNLFGVLFNFKDKKARDDLAATDQTVSAQGTDIAGLKVPAFSEPAANADVRTAVGNVKGGTPIGTLFTNIKAALNGLITLGEMRNYLVNNGTVTESGKYFLDAAYGKTLLDQITALNRKVIKRHDGKLYTILLNYRDSGYQYGIFWYKGEDVPANFTDCYLIFYIDSGMTREMGTIAIRWGKIVSGYVDVETQQIYWYPLLYN